MNHVPGTTIPKPACRLIGEEGNAFSILGRVARALRAAGAPEAVLVEFRRKAMAGSYDLLLTTAMEYVEVE